MIHSLNMNDYKNRSAEVERCTDLAVVDIIRTQAGECTFNTGNTCGATHLFIGEIANAVGTVIYAWTFSVGAIIGADNEQSAEVMVTADVDTTFIATLTITDDVGTTSLSKEFVSIHNENI